MFWSKFDQNLKKFDQNLLKKIEVIAYISNWTLFGCSQSCLCFLNMPYELLLFFRCPICNYHIWSEEWIKMGEKVSVADVNRARGSGGVLKTQQGVRGPSPLIKFLGSK